MDRNTHLLCEAVQEVTLAAWPVIWAGNKYDQDSRNVLETIRDWAEDFENEWLKKGDDYVDSHDWLEEIQAYTEVKCREYLRSLEVEDEFLNRESNIQEFTSLAIEDSIWHTLFFEKNMTREECFKLIREWADEFWDEYKTHDAWEDYKAGNSYYDLVDAFLQKKAEWLA